MKAFSSTFEFDAQLSEGLLHALTLLLPHEAVVDVNSDHLLRVQSLVQQGCAHCRVHPATQQHLRKSFNHRHVSMGEQICSDAIV